MIRRAAITMILAGTLLAAQAQEFRAINPIRAPRVALPAGAQRVSPQVPVPREKILEAVGKITSAWNTPELGKHLGPGFYDKDRLVDNLGRLAPRDAKLRVMGVEGIQVLDQFIAAPTAQQPRRVMTTTVSVTLRTQVEFSDDKGFQRRDGTNEFILDLPEALQ